MMHPIGNPGFLDLIRARRTSANEKPPRNWPDAQGLVRYGSSPSLILKIFLFEQRVQLDLRRDAAAG